MKEIWFFFDASMSWRLAKMIQIYTGFQHVVAHHHELFREGTPDVEWMTALGKHDPKWVVIGGDAAILRNKAERNALREANLTFFCMPKGWPNLGIDEQVWKFFRAWPLILGNADVSPAKVFEVQLSGNAPKVIATTVSKSA